MLLGACARTCSLHGLQSATQGRHTPHFALFKKIEGIGGLDGMRYSNTLKLHTCMHWNGVLVEGSPRNFQQMIPYVHRLRPEAFAYHGAVCAPPNKEPTFIIDGDGAVSGMPNMMSDGFKRKRHNTFLLNATGASHFVNVPCEPMATYLQRAKVRHVDFFSLDVEGAELEVLHTLDFVYTRIDVFIIELNGFDKQRDWRITQLMFNLGYVECVRAISGSGLFVLASKSDYVRACRARGYAVRNRWVV